MARIRTIKPEFFTNESLCELSEVTHFFAAGLLTHSDDDGYFNANPKLIQAALFPIREPSRSIHGMLSELANIAYLEIGRGADGRSYGRIINFTKHQRVNRPSPSKISTLDIDWTHSPPTHVPLTESSLLEGNREQGTGKGTGNEEGSARETGEDPNDNPRHPQPVAGASAQTAAGEKALDSKPFQLNGHPAADKPASSNATSKRRLNRDEARAAALKVPGLDVAVFETWDKYRTSIRKPLTEHSYVANAEKIASMGNRQLELVKQSIDNDWQGLFPERLQQQRVAASGSKPMSKYDQARQFVAGAEDLDD